MAHETSKSGVLCRFYVNGVCRQGSSCQFSHDRSAVSDNVCRYYLQGSCSYGDRCRYDHVRRNSSKKVLSKQDQVQSGRSAWGADTKKTSPAKLCSKEKRSGIGPLVAAPMQSRMVSLGKDRELKQDAVKLPTGKSPEDWVKAKEFVPGQVYGGTGPVSYAMAAKPQSSNAEEFCLDAEVMGACAELPYDAVSASEANETSKLLCPFFANGMCRFGDQCDYVHGEICDMCGMAVLHPTDSAQRDLHQKECVQEHERDMELSFAIARSQDKSCGICMETVMEKNPAAERRFGILENCNHCFCLSCIRTWRCAKQFEKVIVRACPECRVKSNFVIPSQFWVDTKEEKTQLIESYKKALEGKPCRYFDQGKGECPFNDKCFYRHALPDGTLVERKPQVPRRRVNADGEVEITVFHLWDFLERESYRRTILLQSSEDELYMLMNIFADSDSEETSDQDLSDDDW
ncbi:probable E3 ubiquitin-protein ligase makorin-1 [Pomacea canaliculata]|uniref:probable E3 ubiquitin-protein ligase makorin-1 n=1 Tax=Pomacea canaliculata TaxID=400727 RepID=UPI000D7381DA|nr:probable E3 ubiquitin-protein ligase makorin-1 [Pomacea canaliculata]